mmetsp:Transcript_36970/g.103241  ORF Transcript_36970/g.103241 Transcript_36970/m.103241 type:complete len:316 (+) Transcript_36970:31-978(+)
MNPIPSKTAKAVGQDDSPLSHTAHSKNKHVPEQEELGEILKKAGKRALGGGLPGAMAMGIQVGSLMWLRTTMNYQYRHGTTTRQALRALYKDGGVGRFYRGVGPALIQGPMSRFGDTAANAGVLALLESSDSTRDLPVFVKTMCASSAAAAWRVFLMPVDTVKTIMQVEGKNGLSILGKKLKGGGPPVLYHGALAASAATFVGHFPWFFTHNQLDSLLPHAAGHWGELGRNAAIGFTSSVVSDTCSNSIRVVKTTKQTFANPISYPQAVKHVLETDGMIGLFGRGLKTRILANGVQGMMFTVLWKGLQKQFFNEK